MKYKIAAILWTLILTISSLVPKGALPSRRFIDVQHLDKFIHFVSYLILVFLWSYAQKVEKVDRKKYFKILVVSILFGLIIEILQFQLNYGRHFEILDIIANITGSIVGLILFLSTIKS